MVKIEFTEQEIEVAKELLSRTQLKGAEVPAYTQVMSKLSAEQEVVEAKAKK